MSRDRDEDRAYDADVVRYLDDWIEAIAENTERWKAKRAAAGLAAEEMSIQDAFYEGQRAGAKGRGREDNPWIDPYCPQHQAWERGRLGAMGKALARKIA